MKVANPFESFLTCAEDRLAVRRDNPKYLHLILAVTFLHQFQRPVKNDPVIGEHIETTLDDIAIANELATSLFGQSLDELSRPSRELLKLIRKMAAELERKEREATNQKTGAGSALAGGAATFTRRQVREFTGWSDYQVKIHIKQLEELEYLVPLSGRRGQSFCYRLAWDGEGLDGERFMPGLISVEELRRKAEVMGLEVGGSKTEVVGPKTKLEGSSRVQVGLARNGEKPYEHGPETLFAPKLEGINGAHVPLRGSEGGGR